MHRSWFSASTCDGRWPSFTQWSYHPYLAFFQQSVRMEGHKRLGGIISCPFKHGFRSALSVVCHMDERQNLGSIHGKVHQLRGGS